jgi:signal transduction histidine kinase
MAHEIRGPLSAIGLSSEILLADLDQLNADQVRSLAHRIHRGVLWLHGLIENMLCDAAIREGRFTIASEPTDLVDLYRDVERLIEPIVTSRHQELRLVLNTAIPEVSTDARRISQALVNLILNASKFSATGSPIVVTMSAQGGAVLISVADRGPGIAGETTTLFERFYRAAEAQQAGIGGTGLGLAIVKAIVDAHGGAVGAENRRQGGARFWLQLPIDSLAWAQ